VSSKFPEVFVILASISIFFTAFGKPSYLNSAFFEEKEMSKAGILFSYKTPFTMPFNSKLPAVCIVFKFPEYFLGSNASKFLNEDVGVLKLIS
jgi:hypothetical protein